MLNDQNQKDPSQTYCGYCGKQRTPIEICKCRGGRGSGSGSGGGSGEKKTKDTSDLVYTITKADDGSIKVTDQKGNIINNSIEFISKILLSDFQKLFASMLSIKSDNENQTLTIQLKPGLSNNQKAELQEFLNIVKNDCDSFIKSKDLLRFFPEGYSAIIGKDNNSLEIKIRDKTLYNEFVDYLSKNALPLLEKAKNQKQEKQTYVSSAHAKLKH